MTRRTCTIGIALFLAAGAAFSQEKAAMKENIAPGDYEINMTMKTTATTTTAGGPTSQPALEQKITMTMIASMSIGAPDKDGMKKASFTYRRIVLGVTSGPASTVYDSGDSNTASNPIGAAWKQSVGMKVSFDTTGDGNVQNVKGLDEIWAAMAKSDPRVAEQMKQDVWIGQLKELTMSVLTGYLPPNPVVMGEGWKTSTKMDAPGSGVINLEANCNLTEVEKAAGGGRAVIDFESAGALDKPSERKVGAATLAIQRMDVRQKGRITFDLERSMISGAKATGDVVKEMTMTTPDGRKVNVSSKQTSATDITIAPAKP